MKLRRKIWPKTPGQSLQRVGVDTDPHWNSHLVSDSPPCGPEELVLAPLKFFLSRLSTPVLSAEINESEFGVPSPWPALDLFSPRRPSQDTWPRMKHSPPGGVSQTIPPSCSEHFTLMHAAHNGFYFLLTTHQAPGFYYGNF